MITFALAFWTLKKHALHEIIKVQIQLTRRINR